MQITLSFTCERTQEQVEAEGKLDELARRALDHENGAAGAAAPPEDMEDWEERWKQERAKLPAWGRIRFAVRPCSYLDRAHYQRLVREGRRWYQDVTGGRDLDEELGEEDPDYDELVYYRVLVYRRAEMLAAVGRQRTASGFRYLAEVKPPPYAPTLAEHLHNAGWDVWRGGFIPPAWTELPGMMEMPQDLWTSWVDASRDLNAGVLPTVPFDSGRVTRTMER
jgi:hypothetical protein